MGRKPKDIIGKPEFVPKDKRAKALGRAKDAIESSMLSRVLSSDTLAEKIEAIRSINPYFYLLTPLPKEKQNEDCGLF